MFRNKFRQLLKISWMALVFLIILTLILSASQNQKQPTKPKYTSTNNIIVVTDSDWNFYESFEDGNERSSENEADEEHIESIDGSKQNNNCDTIHLAIVCGGYNSTRELYVLLKSILFYRTQPIELHLLVDEISHEILNELFDTWQVPELKVNYYNATQHEQEVYWIPTHHYSSQFGLLKLVFPSLIMSSNENVTKLIMLDTDMLMLGNLNDIHSMFKLMSANNKVPIALVENQSDWYLGNYGKERGNSIVGDRLIWPAIGRGYNTGLILFDLIELRKSNWDQLWREVAELELVTRLSTALADQDIINAVLKTYPHLFLQLPSNFNIQLNDHSSMKKTFRSLNLNKLQLVHWNSPQKYSSRNSIAQNHYLKWYLTFLNWDASLLKIGTCGEKTLYAVAEESAEHRGPDSAATGMEDSCKAIMPRPQDKLRTFLNFFEQEEMANSDQEVTIVIHLSLDRLRALDELAAHWAGPISVAIYLPETETSLLIDSINDSQHLHKRRNIAYHLVFREFGFNYPINRLRNIALNHAKTAYVFLCDADFLPSYNLHDYLKSTIRQLAKEKQEESNNENNSGAESSHSKWLTKQALVVPAFESSQYKFDFPSTKNELNSQLNIGSISMFRAQIWPQGHAPTNYAKWRVSTKMYKVEWQPDYEPFVVTNRNGLARFDERFVGFGWNKVEHIMKLAAIGYEFLVVPEVFVVHQFHPASYDILRHRESQRYRACIRQLKRVVTNELAAKYPGFISKLRSTSHNGTMAAK